MRGIAFVWQFGEVLLAIALGATFFRVDRSVPGLDAEPDCTTVDAAISHVAQALLEGCGAG